jgi:hypothetical protein
MKIKIKEDYRITVWPDYIFETEIAGATKRILKEINRHIDGIKQAYVDFTEKEICEFCKSEWEEADDGCPCCCHKAVEEWEIEHKED